MRYSAMNRVAAGVLFAAVGLFPGLMVNSFAGEPQPAGAGTGEAAGVEETDTVIRAIQEAVKRNSSTVSIDHVDPSVVQAGDLVRVSFTAALEDGSLLATNEKQAAEDPGRKKSALFRMPGQFVPEEILAGKEEIIPGLGEAVLGMKAGEKKRLVIPPEKGFGAYDSALRNQYPTSRKFPSAMRIAADEYVKRFGSFPAVGREVTLNPYLKARVTEVGEKDAALEVLARNGARTEEEIGVTEVRVNGREITTTLTPRIGAEFSVSGRVGKIVAVEGEMFTVDFNSPMAGKNIVLDLEVASLTKASSLDARDVDWSEDHDTALARAQKEGKPVFLILYADWCDFCKKLFAETLPDPRIKAMREKYVWLKVNSEKDKQYFQKYGQKGYPLIVLMNPDGTVAGKIDGFQDGATLSRTLKDFPAVQGKVALSTK